MVLTIIKLIGDIILRILSLVDKAGDRRARNAQYELPLARTSIGGKRTAVFEESNESIYPFEEEEMASQSDNTAVVILAFLTGGIVGAALGILFAPKSGKETRGDITRLATDARDKTGELTQEAVQRLEALVEEAKRKLTGDEGEKTVEEPPQAS